MAISNQVLEAFGLKGAKVYIQEPFGEGHINDTARVDVYDEDDRRQSYILQGINTYVFHMPEEIMENITAVTEALRKAQSRPELQEKVLRFWPTQEGKILYYDDQGVPWRCCSYIEDTIAYQISESPDMFRASGVAFGRFLEALKDFPADRLHETILHFHDTKHRYEGFKEMLPQADPERKDKAAKEILFVLEREALAKSLVEQLEAKRLPLRVTHNDTKLNNILFDLDLNEPISVIDLDTVMPGLAAYDFGDSIRFGASTAAEDEQDLSRVHFDLRLFEAYADGYLSVTAKALSAEEIQSLALGALVITYETGLRFLEDYLKGDVYFKVDRPEHNLDRARTQLQLVSEMEAQYPEMLRILRNYSLKYQGPDFELPLN